MLSDKDRELIKSLAESMTIDEINEMSSLLNKQKHSYFIEVSNKLDSLKTEKRRILNNIESLRQELKTEAERLEKEGDIKLSREFLSLAESANEGSTEGTVELVHESPFLKDLAVNDSVTFGRYRQYIDENTMSPITWKVLDIKNNKALLLSKYALACHEYDSSKDNVPFGSSLLNKWLNSEFKSIAFSGEEQSILVSGSTVMSSDETERDSGQELISILGIEDIEKYMSDEKLRTCYGTVFCLKTADHFIDSTNVSYWIKPDAQHPQASVVTPLGTVTRSTNPQNKFVCVRPTVWVRFK